MSKTIIKVENLSKQYRIGAKEGYKTFRDILLDSAKAPFLLSRDIAKKLIRPLPSAAKSKSKSEENTIWALKDVSFEVKQGEVLGIIGRNGAGKTTLLRVLSKITEPTEGRVELKGRVGSLLEVGTGFHPELTGHENVYLYGAILGMDRWEISKKFDEIIAFAELEKFVDTPVKRYSSGMYMRLAFAVAAHLEPEILLVDEVLAVGDASFQKKCLGKMGDVSRKGRTVLFVSHQMDSIKRLCASCILLSNGRLTDYDIPEKTVSRYLEVEDNTGSEWINLNPNHKQKAYLESIKILNERNQLVAIFTRDEKIVIEMLLIINDTSSNWAIRCDLIKSGSTVFRTSDFDTIKPGDEKGWQKGRYKLRIHIPPFFLNYGTYSVKPHFGLFDIESVSFPPASLVSFQVKKEINCNNFVSRLQENAHPGAVYPKLLWEVKPE
jgi:lipopolysaccharide transport system ATP-binding protein